MKNTKSRKKMLLSSIAMLLVALVALGSATYAWFTVDRTVTADQIQVKAITTAGLEISNTSATAGFAKTVHFADTEVALKPVSWVGTGNGYIPAGDVTDTTNGTYTGTYKSAGSVPSDFPASGVQKTANSYFAAYKVWVRSTAEANGTTYTAKHVQATVKATAGSPSGLGFVRARLVDGTTAANSKNFWDATADDTTAINATAGTTGAISYLQYATDTAVSDTNASATGVPYTLYVWFDGADEDCVNANMNAIANLTIEFTEVD